jgi:hypothetical protein
MRRRSPLSTLQVLVEQRAKALLNRSSMSSSTMLEFQQRSIQFSEGSKISPVVTKTHLRLLKFD